MIIKNWYIKIIPTLYRWVDKYEPGDYSIDYIPNIIISVQDSAHSHNAWISDYKLKINYIKTYKLIVNHNCEKRLNVEMQLFAWDISDFNKGHHFGVFGIMKDDWFIWVRDNTWFGEDYVIWAYGDFILKLSISDNKRQ